MPFTETLAGKWFHSVGLFSNKQNLKSKESFITWIYMIYNSTLTSIKAWIGSTTFVDVNFTPQAFIACGATVARVAPHSVGTNSAVLTLWWLQTLIDVCTTHIPGIARVSTVTRVRSRDSVTLRRQVTSFHLARLIMPAATLYNLLTVTHATIRAVPVVHTWLAVAGVYNNLTIPPTISMQALARVASYTVCTCSTIQTLIPHTVVYVSCT